MSPILLFVAMGVFLSYLGYALITIKKVPLSLSDTFYDLEKIGKPKWLFQLAMVLTGGLLMPYWIEISPEYFQFLAFLSCGGLVFVGVAPAFKVSLEGRVHEVAAIICGGCAILWLLLMGQWIIVLSTLAISLLLIFLRFKREKVFFLEMVAFFSAFIALIWLLIK